MNAIALHQLFIEGNTLHEKLNPGNIIVSGHLAEDIFEFLDVALPVIRRNTYSKQHNRCARGLAGADYRVEVATHTARGEATQAVIATQLKDDQSRTEGLQRMADTRRPALSCFATDAGVNHSMFVPLLFESGLQQSRPGLVNVYTVSSTEAVTEYEYRRGIRTVRSTG